MGYIEPQTRNITSLFRSCTPAEIQEGIAWYEDAYRVADAIATTHNITLHQSAGILSALSPQNSWGANVNSAVRFLETGQSGCMTAPTTKAASIRDMDMSYRDHPEYDPDAHIELILSGLKTINFYRSIVSQGERGIAIDRHAYAVATGQRVVGDIPTLRGKRYAAFADSYTRAAKILSREYETPFSPAQVQSATWTAWRRKFWAPGAFDRHDVIVAD